MNQTVMNWQAIKQVTRMDKPIGTYLLLWPTFWALWIASDGFPRFDILIIFALGVFVMRSAGCVINDFADRKVDGQVERTQHRPLVSGQMTAEQALMVFGFLIGIAFALVVQLSWFTIQLSVIALVLASIYPFMKRYTHLPQVVLGAAFSWGMIMAFAEMEGRIPTVAWLLFAANLLWTVAYDTIYAMVDRADDLKIGVKSTAIWFGRRDKLIIALLQLITLLILIVFAWGTQGGPGFYGGLLFAGALFVYQQRLIRDREPAACFRAFLNNNYVGLVIFIGLLMDEWWLRLAS